LIDTCTYLIKQSTSASHINDGAVSNGFHAHIQKKRTTLWLWLNSDPTELVTVVFHAADGPTRPRFRVCAGIDDSISADDAYTLLQGAVTHFAEINHTTKDNICLWIEQGHELSRDDRIWPLFDRATTEDCEAPADETYPHQNRWPKQQRTWQFKP